MRFCEYSALVKTRGMCKMWWNLWWVYNPDGLLLGHNIEAG